LATVSLIILLKVLLGFTCAARKSRDSSGATDKLFESQRFGNPSGRQKNGWRKELLAQRVDGGKSG
jgi:hypothetical protein